MITRGCTAFTLHQCTISGWRCMSAAGPGAHERARCQEGMATEGIACQTLETSYSCLTWAIQDDQRKIKHVRGTFTTSC
jgi:hypothetical protein